MYAYVCMYARAKSCIRFALLFYNSFLAWIVQLFSHAMPCAFHASHAYTLTHKAEGSGWSAVEATARVGVLWPLIVCHVVDTKFMYSELI